MRSKIIIAASVMVLAVLLIAAVSLSYKNNTLNRELRQTRQTAKQMETDIKALGLEKEKIQADANSYMAINVNITQEKERLQDLAGAAKKAMESKEAELGKLKSDLQRLEAEAAQNNSAGEKNKLEIRVKELTKKIALMEKKAQEERALFYYNLGVAYTQAKHYNEAVAAYERSLQLDSKCADAHYNLALIYDNVKNAQNKAALHYRAYLKLKPNASDREEIEALIGGR